MILVTGDKGYIGQNLMKRLPDAYGFDLKDGLDIRNAYYLDVAFERSQCDTVLHLASLPGIRRSRFYSHEYISTNIEGTWNIVKMCEKYGIKKLIFFSSSSVYGNAEKLPVTEDDPKRPISLYGITKLAGENIVNLADIPTTIIRPFTVYAGRKEQVLHKWISQYRAGKPLTVYGPDHSCRGCVYVEDLIDFVLSLIDMPWPWQHQDFNIGGPIPITLKDTMDAFRKLPGVIFHRQEGAGDEVIENYPDTAKARQWGFNPVTLYHKKIREIIANELNSGHKI